MSTLELKENLHGLIDQMQDFDILEAVYTLLSRKIQPLETQETDFWDELPDDVKAGIEIGIEQAESGNVIPHEVVMKQIKSKLKTIS